MTSSRRAASRHQRRHPDLRRLSRSHLHHRKAGRRRDGLRPEVRSSSSVRRRRDARCAPQGGPGEAVRRAFSSTRASTFSSHRFRSHIPNGERFDMTDLIERLLAPDRRGCDAFRSSTTGWTSAGPRTTSRPRRRQEGEAADESPRHGRRGLRRLDPRSAAARRGAPRARRRRARSTAASRSCRVFAIPSSSSSAATSDRAAVVRRAVAGMDAVVHLAAIVGDPACARQPERARAVNLDASLGPRSRRRAGRG